MPAVPKSREGPRRLRLAVAVISVAAFALSKWHFGSPAAFAGHARASGVALSPHGQRDCGVGCHAMKPILRRDPKVNENLQKFVQLQVKLSQRQAGIRQQSAARARLAKLGLLDKIKSVNTGLWHDGHPAVGDVFTGFWSHPEDSDDMEIRNPVEITITGEGEAKWKEVEDFGTAKFQSDFSIKDDRDRAMYVFNKFNPVWRDFTKPPPVGEELEHISLDGLRIYFSQVAKVQGFPSEDDFKKNCADPSKGMTMDEFITWLAADDPAYLSRTFSDVYTGRRIRFETKDVGKYIVMDGDFQNDAEGIIIGYMELDGDKGGTFNLKLSAKVEES